MQPETEKLARTVNKAGKIWLILFIGLLVLCCGMVCLAFIAFGGSIAGMIAGISNMLGGG